MSETKGTPPPPVKGHPEEVEDMVAPVGDRVVVAILNFSTLIPQSKDSPTHYSGDSTPSGTVSQWRANLEALLMLVYCVINMDDD